VAFTWRVWPMDAVPIELSRAQARHERVPVVIGSAGRGIYVDRAGRSGVVCAVEQEQFNPGSAPGEDAKVHSTVANRGPKRRTPARALKRMTDRPIHSHRHDDFVGRPVDPLYGRAIPDFAGCFNFGGGCTATHMWEPGCKPQFVSGTCWACSGRSEMSRAASAPAGEVSTTKACHGARLRW
jgi:hypothetical protein